MNRIVCVGNRLWAEDGAGPAVHDELRARRLDDVELVDGGVAGLGLLRWLEGDGRVILVDGVEGFGQPGDVLVLSAGDVAALSSGVPDHGAGLPYLLATAPLVCEPPAQVMVVGLESPFSAGGVTRAADLALRLAREGCHAAV